MDFTRKYPRIQNLTKLNNKFLRLILIKFYSYFVKKNKRLNYFFFNKSQEIQNINFDLNNVSLSNAKLLESLSSNGIVILGNVLNISEIENINKFFNEIEQKKIISDWLNNEIIDASSVKYGNENKNVKISFLRKDTKDLPGLNKLIKVITKQIFGNSISTSAEFFIHDCKDKEQNNIYEDTNFHIDRYLPCLKIIYSPNEITSADAPFGYIKKTHKLNNKYMNKFVLNSENFVIQDNKIPQNLKKDTVEIKCPSNSLIIS